MAARLAATSREPEEWATATESARETRARVADQLRELVIEGDQMGARAQLVERIRGCAEAERRIAEAQGRQQQAAEEGLPQHEHRMAEREGRETLRAALMNLAVTAASWVAAIDHSATQSAASSSGEPAAI